MNVGVHLPAEFSLGDAFELTPSDLPFHSFHPNGSLWDPVLHRFVYSAVYRLDDTLAPVPDLAEEPCEVTDDLIVITCRLRDVSFHDGSPLTADDVAFTYALLISDACRMPASCFTPANSSLVSVTAVDDRIVKFTLSGPDPTFITTRLPEVFIEPRQRVEDAYAEFVEASSGADPGLLRDLASRAAPPDPNGIPQCASFDDGLEADAVIAEIETVAAGIGRELRGRDQYAIGPGGAIDDCAYFEYLGRVLTDAADALTLTGIDSIAAAYRVLELPVIPVGSGPWRVASIDLGVGMRLEAFDGFHRGVAATPRVDVRLVRSTAEAVDAVRSGTIDWLIDAFPESVIAEGVGEAPGVVWVEYNRLAYVAVHYNLREGRLFADANLRAAMELCIDKDETVAAATGGSGVPIYSPVSPSMWAYEPDLPRLARDPEAARGLIEASGWTMAEDGIYHKDEQRLSTDILLRDDSPQMLAFVELLAFQVADCGIAVAPKQVPRSDLFAATEWPLTVPGTSGSWDALLSGWIVSPDPDPSEVFHSRAITTESNPLGFNYMGYGTAESDALLDQGRATYDQRERARIYREYQRVLASDRPVLFGWSSLIREPRNERLASTRGTLATTTPNWWWELETLFVPSAGPDDGAED